MIFTNDYFRHYVRPVCPGPIIGVTAAVYLTGVMISARSGIMTGF
jgi:Asp/Glu/hydantoin racemase